ncbi:DUF3829 domain-containing protein [Comamonas koreensis]|uniref:YiiG family protein n=1 Tax=Comamonas koreensis TaxID=160825 RepID=A0AAW4XTW5_9BURK|nr:DUF3829 domain-containing protein [Comamonas koreensis]MCD2165552.1 YiiG family protein [Comamonas koreensis]
MNIIKYKTSVAIIAIGFLATGCEKSPASSSAVPAKPSVEASVVSAASNSAVAPAPDKTAALQREAQSTYSKVYNKLIAEHGGTASAYKNYLAWQLLSNKPKRGLDEFDSASESFKEILDTLQKARATGSGDPQLDEAVDKLINSGKQLLAAWSPMDSYLKTKGFLEDNYERARAADGEMKAGFTATLASIDGVGNALDRVQDQQRRDHMAKLKAAGDMVNYNMLASMAAAKSLMVVIDQAQGRASAKDKVWISKADAAVAVVEAAQQEYTAELNKAKAEAAPGKEPNSSHNSMTSYMQSMIGQVREFKATGHPGHLGNAVKDYNNMVGNYNRHLNKF